MCGYHHHGTQGEAFGMEVVITFIMTLVVYAVSHPNRIASGSLRDKAVTIGFVAAVLNFVAVCIASC
jgi:glycerol uptake facilitator-like aquaporin